MDDVFITFFLWVFWFSSSRSALCFWFLLSFFGVSRAFFDFCFLSVLPVASFLLAVFLLTSFILPSFRLSCFYSYFISSVPTPCFLCFLIPFIGCFFFPTQPIVQSLNDIIFGRYRNGWIVDGRG